MIVTYDLSNLADILSEMADYLEQNNGEGYENEFKGDLFNALTQTALFHDACGKEIERNDDEVIVTTEY